MPDRILVIGAGITGLFTTLYLSENGYDVTLVDRGDISRGTSGKFHGMIHSGSRYSTNDRESAIECIRENARISKIASDFIEDTGGYFVALNEEEEKFGDKLMEGNKKCGIETSEVDPQTFIMDIEPRVSKNAKRVFRVPDKIIHAYEFSMAVAAESIMKGARILTYSSIKPKDNGSVTISDGTNTKNENFDTVINTAGPWAGIVSELFGSDELKIMPTLGYMVVYPSRFVNSVINRMRPPSDGDIFVPYGGSTILGTMAIVTDDPDNPQVEEEDINDMVQEGKLLIPGINGIKYSRTYYSSRPLIEDSSGNARSTTRDFRIMQSSDNSKLISVAGGKFTTGRLIGEEILRTVCSRNGDSFSIPDIDLNSSYSRFLEKFGSGKYSRILRSIQGRTGTIDEERILPSVSAVIGSMIDEISWKEW
ncbi:FAD-dependent oxidoreductase [Oxyplasma meridianum]|uniref:FAD-dependent oxidoreductase n=1 Tax=Oxyplasma meridianum TaxID=3073602 RepID=A0AAX4NJB5_9ARCH